MAQKFRGGSGSVKTGRGVRVSTATRASFQRAAARIAAAAKRISADVGVGLRLIGEEIMLDVKASRPGHGVPVDTGALRASGRVTGPASSGATGQATVELSFGGAAAPYALVQHEVLTYHHELGEARYLVRGLERWRSGGKAALAALRHNAQAGIDAVGRGAGGGLRQGRDVRGRFTKGF